MSTTIATADGLTLIVTLDPPVDGQVAVEVSWHDEFEGSRRYLLGVDRQQVISAPQGPIRGGLLRYEGNDSPQRLSVAADGGQVQAMLEAQPVDPVEWRPAPREGRYLITEPLTVPEQSATSTLILVDPPITPESESAEATCATTDRDGNPIETFLQVHYGESGQPLDRSTNRSASAEASHSQMLTGLPAEGLVPDTDYVARFVAEDEGTSSAEAFVSFRTAPPVVVSPGDVGTRLRALPAGRDWVLFQDSTYGGIDPAHSRITSGLEVAGVPCYEHRVRQGDTVEDMVSVAPPVALDFADWTEILGRVHFRTTGHSGQDGKHVALALGYGYRGDMIDEGSGHYSPLISYSDAFGSRDPGVATIMHPDRGPSANGLRLLATHAASPDFVPGLKNQPAIDTPYPELAGQYYGDLVGTGPTTYPLNTWMVLDVIVHRTEGYRLYRDGVLEAESAFAFGTAPFDVWDAIHAACWWPRHAHGGPAASLDALRDYEEFWGDFSIWAA